MRISGKELAAMAANNPALRKLVEEFNLGKKRNKYSNVRVYEYPDGMITEGTKISGHGKPFVYDSKKEYSRWCELRLLEKGKAISELKKQQIMVICEKGVYNGKVINRVVYKADFVYIRNGKTVVEDVKAIDKRTGLPRTTKDFNLKWKMLKLKYPDFLFEIY